jgi:hypothetical protein
MGAPWESIFSSRFETPSSSPAEHFITPIHEGVNHFEENKLFLKPSLGVRYASGRQKNPNDPFHRKHLRDGNE